MTTLPANVRQFVADRVAYRLGCGRDEAQAAVGFVLWQLGSGPVCLAAGTAAEREALRCLAPWGAVTISPDGYAVAV